MRVNVFYTSQVLTILCLYGAAEPLQGAPYQVYIMMMMMMIMIGRQK